MKTAFLKTACFLCFFLFISGSLSAQESPIPVKIESPTSSFVLRSFTISGSAQAGAKLHLTINGKTFGRYRATIGGTFTIGVSVPEDELSITIDHLVDGEIQSSDSIRLHVGAEKAAKKIDNPKTEPEEKTASETDETQKAVLPSAGKIPADPNTLKKQYIGETEGKDPVIVGNKPDPYYPNKTARGKNHQSSMGGRVAFEALGGFAITAGMFLFTFVALETNRNPTSEFLLSLFAAELTLAPLAVYFGGNIAGGKGDLWTVYVGEFFGLAGSLGFILAGESAGSDSENVLFLLAFLSPFVGMITGYEISHATNVSRVKTFSMQPTIQIDKDVKSVGLRLSF